MNGAGNNNTNGSNHLNTNSQHGNTSQTCVLSNGNNGVQRHGYYDNRSVSADMNDSVCDRYSPVSVSGSNSGNVGRKIISSASQPKLLPKGGKNRVSNS